MREPVTSLQAATFFSSITSCDVISEPHLHKSFASRSSKDIPPVGARDI